MHAIATNAIDLIKCLLDIGADINLKACPRSLDKPETPLAFALDTNRSQIAELLLEHGASAE